MLDFLGSWFISGVVMTGASHQVPQKIYIYNNNNDDDDDDDNNSRLNTNMYDEASA